MSKKKPFTLHIINNDEGLESLKAVLPNDGTSGLIVGEDWEVRALHELIGEYLISGKHSGEIPDYHKQLGASWLTIGEAAALSFQLRMESIPERTIRWAASHNFITGAKKNGRDWQFPKRTFLFWLNHRPKRGRKTENKEGINA